MVLKKFGYYIVKGKCLKVYLKKMRNKKGKSVLKKVNYRGKLIKKGTKIYKTKSECLRQLKKKSLKNKKRRTKSVTKSVTKSRTKSVTKFGEKTLCTYGVPYFGSFVPSIAKSVSGPKFSSIAWAWPTPPGAKAYDLQQGSWLKTKNIKN